MKLSKSPDRGAFQTERYVARLLEQGKTPNPQLLEMYESDRVARRERESDPSWAVLNLEHDLRSTHWVVSKARHSEVYAQHIYAALCNMQWQNKHSNQLWSCTWRTAGGIVADLCGKGDYIDWYCSGMRGDCERISVEKWLSFTPEQEQSWRYMLDYVGEGCVTSEIKEDFYELGWTPVEWKEDESSY